jgi:hypothetical protein
MNFGNTFCSLKCKSSNDELPFGVLAEQQLVIRFLNQYRLQPIIKNLLESKLINETDLMTDFFVNLVFQLMNGCLVKVSQEDPNDFWSLMFHTFDFVRQNAQQNVASRYYILFERMLCNPWLKVLLEVNHRMCGNEILRYHPNVHAFIQLLLEQSFANPLLYSYFRVLNDNCLLHLRQLESTNRHQHLVYVNLLLTNSYSVAFSTQLKFAMRRVLEVFHFNPFQSEKVNKPDFTRMSQADMFLFASNESKAYLLNKKKMKEVKRLQMKGKF